MSKPKSKRPGVSRRSPADNVPHAMFVDKGTDLLSLAAASVATGLGIDTATAKSLCPMNKGAIESAFTARTSGLLPVNGKRSDASGFKPYTLKELERALLTRIVDYNRQPAHRSRRSK